MEHGDRVKSHRFTNRLRHICKKIEITSKSPHKIRKTYGSKLYDSKDVTEAFIITQMGHTDISCLKKHYYYNRMEVDEQTEMLNKAAIF
jgi:integrase/recombinase XerD